jgi:hypothetical protein
MDRKRYRKHFLYNKWLSISKDLAYTKIINCTNVVELKNIGKYLYTDSNGTIALVR